MFFFSLMRGRKDPNTTISVAINGQPAKRHLNGVSLVADGGPTLNAGLVAL